MAYLIEKYKEIIQTPVDKNENKAQAYELELKSKFKELCDELGAEYSAHYFNEFIERQLNYIKKIENLKFHTIKLITTKSMPKFIELTKEDYSKDLTQDQKDLVKSFPRLKNRYSKLDINDWEPVDFLHCSIYCFKMENEGNTPYNSIMNGISIMQTLLQSFNNEELKSYIQNHYKSTIPSLKTVIKDFKCTSLKTLINEKYIKRQIEFNNKETKKSNKTSDYCDFDLGEEIKKLDNDPNYRIKI